MSETAWPVECTFLSILFRLFIYLSTRNRNETKQMRRHACICICGYGWRWNVRVFRVFPLGHSTILEKRSQCRNEKERMKKKTHFVDIFVFVHIDIVFLLSFLVFLCSMRLLTCVHLFVEIYKYLFYQPNDQNKVILK